MSNGALFCGKAFVARRRRYVISEPSGCRAPHFTRKLVPGQQCIVLRVPEEFMLFNKPSF